MTVAEWISCGISAAIGIMMFYLQRQQRKRDKKAEDNAERRKRESLLSLEMMSANNQLSYALAMAVQRGHPNGEVEVALAAYQEAKDAYDHFKAEMAAEKMAES
jgi:hypothetical protein